MDYQVKLKISTVSFWLFFVYHVCDEYERDQQLVCKYSKNVLLIMIVNIILNAIAQNGPLLLTF